jgi:4-hydroxy-2-oxoheptanedioate aldolase
MKPNPLCAKIADRVPILGVISNLTDPTAAEICGFAGLDFYMIDGEHSGVSTAQVADLVRACECAGTVPLARVRSNDPKLVLQFLDAGVMGIMMPGLSTLGEVERLVEAIKYPPRGIRGLGPVRVADYMLGPMPQAEYVALANANTLVLPQIEDIAALPHLDAMLQVPGVDGFVIGPRDLAMTMGYYDGPNHPEVQAVIDQIIQKVTGAGLVVGSVAATADQAKALIAKGVGLVLNSVAGLISQSAKAFLKAV